MPRALGRLVLFIGAVFLAGCHHSGPNLVGTWSSGMGGALTTYHFRQDGTFKIENVFDGTRATVEGTYSTDGGKLELNPSKSDVQGQGPKADQIRSVIMQPSRLSLIVNTADDIQLGLDNPPLMIQRVSAQP